MLRRFIAAASVLVSMGWLGAVWAAPASADVPYTCFGYTGTFADPGVYPTAVGPVNWPTGANNCFGISPGRHIWSTSPGHPWSTIPGNGLADGITAWQEITYSSTDYVKTLQVWVASSGNRFCESWWSGTGWTGYWSLCNGGIAPN